MTPLRVLIVGCGKIAGSFDANRPADELPYTHAGAYRRDGRFTLAACVEPDGDRRKNFMCTWGIPSGFSSIEEAMNPGSGYDVISICSPTASHAHDVGVAIKLRPKLIFCEKPLTGSIRESELIVAQCNEASILLAVNHTRRWDPDISTLESEMRSGLRGRLRSVVGIYNKGILNNGSHMVDLVHRLVGPLEIVKVGQPTEDFVADDPTVPVWFKGPDDVPVHFVCGHAADYGIFELQLIFSHGVLTMEDGGLSWRERRSVDSDTFRGYRALDEGVRRSGKYQRAMLEAVGNLYHAIRDGESLASTGESALAAQRVCEKIERATQVPRKRLRQKSAGYKDGQDA